MAFLTVGKAHTPEKQRLYIMEMVLPSGLTVVKCGKASGISSKARMLQICASVYDKFRRTPMVKIQRDREVPADKVFEYETIVHKFFKGYQYNTTHKFDGNTECFVVPCDDMVAAYDLIIEGAVPDFIYELPESIIEDALTF